MSVNKSPPVPKKPTWSLRTTSIVKELGQGFYSKVYLAQDYKNGFVALKTVDNQRNVNSEECISNEIDILATLGAHLNIVKLLGFNKEERLIVMEYCFNGNLKDYIFRYRDYYMDEINPITGELNEETFLYKSPSDSDSFPMSDFMTSMHADIDNDTSLRVKKKDVPVLMQSKSLIKTRRLLYWSYQISKGLKYLSDLGIIHRDVALRNMLLTNNDVVKIADFGLAVNIFRQEGGMRSPTSNLRNSMPQYCSRSNKPQPYKWMAVESLVSNIFSPSSDVWSYGVTLWEMFTLGSEPYGNISPIELANSLQTGQRLTKPRLAPNNVARLMSECWTSDPSLRPGFDKIVIVMSGYMSNVDKQSYDARSRLDSGIGMVDGGYVDMLHMVSTPSTGTGTTSKSSTRSRTISKCSELSWLPSSSSSRVPSPKVARHSSGHSYWANYKMMNSSENQVYSSVDQFHRQQQRAGQVGQHDDIPSQSLSTNSTNNRQFNTLDTYLRNKNLHY